jgi:hypothetical protein
MDDYSVSIIEQKRNYLKALIDVVDIDTTNHLPIPEELSRTIEEEICWMEYNGFREEIKDLVSEYKKVRV